MSEAANGESRQQVAGSGPQGTDRQPLRLLVQQHSAGRCQTVAGLEGTVPTLPASSFYIIFAFAKTLTRT